MENLVLFALVGFFAQLVDGALGMAYGVLSNAFLLSLGISPAVASASVHMAEVVTTGVSGATHHVFGNVDRRLFRRLVGPGILGGVTGAYLLTRVDGDVLKPYVSAYLLLMGLLILWRGLKAAPQRDLSPGWLVSTGLVGGFCDAVGGGGWGPLVTGTLVARGSTPRFTVGSVNAAEFFVTAAQSLTFFLTLGGLHWQAIFGLLLGGALAAPLAAGLCRRVPTRPLAVLVGALLVALSLRSLLLAS